MASLLNFEKWLDAKRHATKVIEQKATAFVRARIKTVLHDAVKVSPQWSGNYAASWTIATNKLGPGEWQRYMLKVDPWTDLRWWDDAKPTNPTKSEKAAGSKELAKSAGHPEALRRAAMANDELIDNEVQWNTNVSLVNRAPIAEGLDAGTVHLRNVNMIAAPEGVMIYLKAKYPFMS